MIGIRIVRGLLIFGSDHHDIFTRGDNRAGIFRRDVEFSVGGSNHAHQHLPIFQSDVQRIRGGDCRDRVPRNGDLAGEFGFQDEILAVVLDDAAGEPVAILHGYLIGQKNRGKRKEEQEANGHIHLVYGDGTEAGTSALLGQQPGSQQFFDDHYVAPRSIELAVAPVHADFPESERPGHS